LKPVHIFHLFNLGHLDLRPLAGHLQPRLCSIAEIDLISAYK
jgi:hypothetical protein